ncbi:response regulator [Frankia sp. Mgl5]|uniref:response regulator n=1 Tax=Frankia sp. Mgl5 TaxID=2933793 RepID=UPI0027E5986B|nr:response regulator [Frankia sp. Mgl5]
MKIEVTWASTVSPAPDGASARTKPGTSETAEESIAAVAALAPDLVPMDVNLPGMDGLAATRLLRVSGAVSSVVLMSSYDADHYADVATECGAIGYLTKVDLDPDGLQAVWDRGRRRPGPST